MIDLCSWNTSNGRKVAIMLEELGLPYTFHPVDISKGEQFAPQFLAISPNNKIPALVDSDGPGGEPISVFESGAILIYLAEKMGSALWPADVRTRMEVLQWLMVQIGGVGPMFGQALHFKRYADTTIPYAIKRYGDEVDRLCLVLDGRLADHEFLAAPSRSPTLPRIRGSIVGPGWTSIGPATPTSNAGSMRSPLGRRCRADLRRRT